jgi:hypothetical protein
MTTTMGGTRPDAKAMNPAICPSKRLAGHSALERSGGTAVSLFLTFRSVAAPNWVWSDEVKREHLGDAGQVSRIP